MKWSESLLQIFSWLDGNNTLYSHHLTLCMFEFMAELIGQAAHTLLFFSSITPINLLTATTKQAYVLCVPVDYNPKSLLLY
jgi:hypothetical protein